ncbi:MAG: NAD-dependent malic enzyme [Dehalococcoidia bacterium]
MEEIVRTIRCQDINVPGTLGKVTTAIGKVGVGIGNITTLHMGSHFVIRDIEVYAENEEKLSQVVRELSKLKETSVLQVRDDVMETHKYGKIKMVNTLPITSVDVLRRVYTPGVAQVCKLLEKEPWWKDYFTAIPYFIAIVTDGTAILGLGDIGPIAGMPVMEGKAALLQQLVGISGIPILLDTKDSDQIIETVKHIAPTFSGIHLEDISSPRCFYIEERLADELSIPVMHDDQKGTAVVVLGALINACKMAKISLQEAKIGMIGLGAAGFSIGKFIYQYTGNPVLGTARTESSIQRHVQAGGVASTMDEIMQKADIVIATTGVKGLIEPSMVRKGQIIFALTNPYPEITPEAARAAGAAIAADGRSVNNLLGYPGIWRGTIDARATKINYEMLKAASLAIAASTDEGMFVPIAVEPKVHLAVTHAVAKAAMESGVAQRMLDDDYFASTNCKEPLWM